MQKTYSFKSQGKCLEMTPNFRYSLIVLIQSITTNQVRNYFLLQKDKLRTTIYPSLFLQKFLCQVIKHNVGITPRSTPSVYRFSSVQFSHSVVSDSLQPHESQHARPPCPSPTPRVYPNPCPSSWWCHPAISSSVVPFSSCPQSLPASGSFPMSQLFTWVSIGGTP